MVEQSTQSQESPRLSELVTHGSIMDINQALESLTGKILMEELDLGPFAFYQRIAQVIPHSTPLQKQSAVLEAATNSDPQVAQVGKNVLILLNLRTIYNAIKSYTGSNEDENNELIQDVIVAIMEHTNSIHTPIAQQIHNISSYTAAKVVAGREGMPQTWVVAKKDQPIKGLVDHDMQDHPFGLNTTQVEALAEAVSEQTGLAAVVVKPYIRYRNALMVDAPKKVDPVRTAEQAALGEDLQEALDALTEREGAIIRLRFALGEEDKKLTLDEVGEKLGISGEYIRHIEDVAIRKLRHPSRSKKLEDYRREDARVIIAMPEEGRERFGRILTENEAYYFRQLPYILDLLGAEEFSIAKTALTLVQKRAFASVGITQIGDLFTHEPLQVARQLTKADYPIINAALQLLQNELEILKYHPGRETSFMPQSDLALLTHLVDPIIKNPNTRPSFVTEEQIRGSLILQQMVVSQAYTNLLKRWRGEYNEWEKQLQREKEKGPQKPETDTPKPQETAVPEIPEENKIRSLGEWIRKFLSSHC